MRSELEAAIRDEIERRGWTQVEAGDYLGVTQPSISRIRRADGSSASLDRLVDMASDLSLKVHVQIER
nr:MULTISPECIES: XRE family transcriptional regulator [unclassified Thioalkalivibrio]